MFIQPITPHVYLTSPTQQNQCSTNLHQNCKKVATKKASEKKAATKKAPAKKAAAKKKPEKDK